MANYIGTARTNYFRVKDIEAFKKSVKDYEVIVINEDDKVGLLDNSWNGDFEYYLFNETTDEYDEDTDLVKLVSKHLQDEEVAIFMSAGAEKQVYISGYSIAVNNKNEQRRIDLDDIYNIGQELGKNITRAEC